MREISFRGQKEFERLLCLISTFCFNTTQVVEDNESATHRRKSCGLSRRRAVKSQSPVGFLAGLVSPPSRPRPPLGVNGGQSRPGESGSGKDTVRPTAEGVEDTEIRRGEREIP